MHLSTIALTSVLTANTFLTSTWAFVPSFRQGKDISDLTFFRDSKRDSLLSVASSKNEEGADIMKQTKNGLLSFFSTSVIVASTFLTDPADAALKSNYDLSVAPVTEKVTVATKSSSKNAVTFPPKSTGTTKPAIRDTSTKGTVVQESKKTTVQKVDAKEKVVKKVDSKEKDVKKINSNDKVAKKVDSKVSTTKDVKKVDTAPVDPVALEKRSLSNAKTKLTEVTDSVNVAKREAEKRGGVLKKASSAVSTANKKVSAAKKTLIDANDKYSDAKAKETPSTLKEVEKMATKVGKLSVLFSLNIL